VSGAAGPTPDTSRWQRSARYAVERRDWQLAAELQPRETPFPYNDAMTWLRAA